MVSFYTTCRDKDSDQMSNAPGEETAERSNYRGAMSDSGTNHHFISFQYNILFHSMDDECTTQQIQRYNSNIHILIQY